MGFFGDNLEDLTTQLSKHGKMYDIQFFVINCISLSECALS